jgi:tetratricopeptide (TPR) repeat protein
MLPPLALGVAWWATFSPRATGVRTPWREQASRCLLAVGTAGAALAVGTVHTVTLCVVTTILAFAAVLGWWGAEPMRARPPATLLLLAGIVLTVYTMLQCVPMPTVWLAVIAPHNADVWSRALVPLHEAGPGWAPITLDPIATRVEVLKGVAYLMAFLAALRVARKKEGVGFLSGVVIVTGVALAAAALLHPAFGARKLFGLYEAPPEIWGRHVAPLMNPNNLAGYINIAFCLSLGAALAPAHRVPRPILAIAVLMLGASQVWIASRGGVITMILGAIVVIAIARLARSPDQRAAATLSILTAAVALAGGILIVLAGQDVSSELFDRDVSKLGMFQHVMRMLPAVPIFGCGRGAFESAFPTFRIDAGYVTFAYPENFVAQWTLEWGVPVGILGLMAIALALRPTAILARSSSAGGAWAALSAFAVQNLGDLGTEVPGLMLACVVCAAMIVGGTSGREPRWRVESWAKATRTVAALGAGVAVAAIAMAGWGASKELHRDRKALYNAAIEQRAAVAAVHAMARIAMLRHPAEPYLPFVVGARALAERDDNPIPWMTGTLERASMYGPAHQVLAQTIAGRSPSQARMEYRHAMTEAPSLVPSVMQIAPNLVESYHGATEIVPDGPIAEEVVDSLVERISDRLPATSARLDRDLLARVPQALGVVARIAVAATQDVEASGGTPWCEGPQRSGCVLSALEKARSYQALAPERCAGFELEARVRIASGDPSGLSFLASAADRVRDRIPCLKGLASLAGAVHDAAQVDSALAQIVAAGCPVDAECAGNLAWAAAQEESRGNVGKARRLYQQAYERAPDQDSLLANEARLASSQGLHGEAARDYERLARIHPADQHWSQAVNREREAAARTLMEVSPP